MIAILWISILLIAFVIIYVIYYQRKPYEAFGNRQQQSFPSAINLLGSVEIEKNVRLNKYNRIDEKTIKPPLPRIGETGCHRVICPVWIDETAICWFCQ